MSADLGCVVEIDRNLLIEMYQGVNNEARGVESDALL